MAETIDWATALAALDTLELTPDAIRDTLGVLLKYQDDLAKLTDRGNGAHPDRGAGEGRRLMRLTANIIAVVRLLRRAGLPVGPGQALLAVEAVEAIGVEERAAMRQALFAALVTRPSNSRPSTSASRSSGETRS